MVAWMPLPSPWGLISITITKRVASTSSDDDGSFGSTSSTRCLGTVSVFCGEFHHALHLNRTVATLLRRLHADRLWELLAGDARGHLQSYHMGDWLIHRDSSSVEYNTRSPTKTSHTKSRSSLFWVYHNESLQQPRIVIFGTYTFFAARPV